MDKKIIVITGASGTGKTTISQYLKQKYNIPPVLTHTTRAPRAGEVDGVDYHFETDETFSKNHYLEQVEYSGFHYGSSEESLEQTWKTVDVASIVVDTAGAISYKKKYGDTAVVIFLEVDVETVAHRLHGRGDDPERLTRRINSEEFKRDLRIPDELRGKSYEIVNKDIKITEKKVDKVVNNLKSK
ncbi:guanylate kinase [Companilactobacillus nodensis]|uniref:Guanylate kinase n=1 Tax=Companilactobacillus nodensis DSM 19682 = JCM 14932 = NBRC 107160 TaxID=1423775 RepID=A0A0R1KHU6_9LACO|nr:AAA family ATPase [Companilactobacillus nodensis]KRK81107.1 Guanylate kinase [Companilactobacillus nodensis DSM 19682 = JCM 14932 = NBRC 107160]